MASYSNGNVPTSAMSPIPAAYHTHGTTAYLMPGPADAFLRVAAAFEKKFGKRLVAMSFYRPRSDQVRIFLKNYRKVNRGRKYKTDRGYNGSIYALRSGMAPVASPDIGSNHGLGTTVDFNAGVNIRGSKEHNWMLAEGTKYGWDWTEGRRIGEAWHWGYKASQDRMKSAPKPGKVSSFTPATSVVDVLDTQELLQDLGYAPGKADGKLGSATMAAVKAFQKDAGIKVDGSPGPTTRKALDKAMATLAEEIDYIKRVTVRNQEKINEGLQAIDWIRRVTEANQKRIDLVAAKVGPINRKGKEISLRQEIADAKTIATANAGGIDKIQAALSEADVDATETKV